MERRDVILTAVLSTLAALLALAVALASCYWWHKRKRKRDEEERLDELDRGPAPAPAPGKEPGGRSNGRSNGFLSLRTPLISTKTLGPSSDQSGASPSPAPSPARGGACPRPAPGRLTPARDAPDAGDQKRWWMSSRGRMREAVAAYRAQLETAGTPGSKSPASSAGGGGGASLLASDSKGGGAAGGGGAQGKTLAPKGDHPSMAFLQSRSISLVDMYIDNSEPVENVGQIHFSLEYDFQNTTLILRILMAKELPAKDISGTSDPYVRVTLLPDKKHRLETKIKRRTLNPRWNETFYFEGFPIQKLQSRVLHLHVFDYDRFSRDDSIGEVFLPLCQVDLSEKPSFWKALKPPAKDKCGELLTSLCYHPSNSVLTLTLLKARNLKAKDINGKSDPYVKVWLQFGDKRIEKRKTPIFKCTLNPVFNESFSFNVPWEKIRECSLDVMVMDFDNIGRNELIGRILLAGKNGSGASETKHWQDMITKPRQTIVQWHRLKPE